jgi:hypothetical protein
VGGAAVMGSGTRIECADAYPLCSFMIATALLSFWIANVAVVLLMLPIAIAIIDKEEHSDHKAITDENLETEHAEFIVEFELQCEQISNLTAIDVPLLAIFPAIEEIDVQVIYLGGQIKQELTPNNTLISLKN